MASDKPQRSAQEGRTMWNSGYNLQPAPGMMSESGAGSPTAAPPSYASTDRRREEDETHTAVGSVALKKRGKRRVQNGRTSRGAFSEDSAYLTEDERKEDRNNKSLLSTGGYLVVGLLAGVTLGGTIGWCLGHCIWGPTAVPVVKGSAVVGTKIPGMTQAAVSATHAASHASLHEATLAATTTLTIPPAGSTPAAAATFAAHNTASTEALAAASAALNSSSHALLTTPAVVMTEGMGPSGLIAGSAIGGGAGVAAGAVSANVAANHAQERRRIKS